MGNTLSFFTNLKGFEKYEALVQEANKKKRGKYHKHPKIQEYDPYQHISELYTTLASYLPYPIGQNHEIVTELFGLRSWFTIDEDENNIEPPLKLFQAEIIGTENYNVYDRILLHEKLLDLLRKRIQLKNAVKLLKEDLQKVNEKYTLSEFTLWQLNLKR